MVDILLQELSNADLDWLIGNGSQIKLGQGQRLLDLKEKQDSLYLLVDGRCRLDFSANLAESSPQIFTVDELGQGEVLGIGSLLGMAEEGMVYALEPTLALALPIQKVQAKLGQDVAFAAHFYRAIAVLLSNRLRRIFERPDRIRFWGERSAKEVLSVFGELRDSDVDWLVSFGQTEIIPADRVVLQAGRPVDALYIVLDGQMAISASQQGTFNPFLLCFAGSEAGPQHQKAFATLSKGRMPGIISFLDFRPLPVTIRTVKESLVFAVPRHTLATKLQVDDSFASRFYRVVAVEVLELLQSVSSRLLHPETIGPLAAELDEELAMEDLQQMSEGAKKFNWMLSQLGVAVHG